MVKDSGEGRAPWYDAGKFKAYDEAAKADVDPDDTNLDNAAAKESLKFLIRQRKAIVDLMFDGMASHGDARSLRNVEKKIAARYRKLLDEGKI